MSLHMYNGLLMPYRHYLTFTQMQIIDKCFQSESYKDIAPVVVLTAMAPIDSCVWMLSPKGVSLLGSVALHE